MQIRIFTVDAFASAVFSGNPAAVCLLDHWLDEEKLQAIAAENNLSETAFVVGEGNRRALRWFTPKCEIDLCGHATLASAFVLFSHSGTPMDSVMFDSKSGPLGVSKDGDLLRLEFPRRPPVPRPPPQLAARALGKSPRETVFARDYLFIYESEDDVREMKPDFDLLAKIDTHGIVVTAPGKSSDYVLRFFAPNMGIPEDPVTGSVQCALAPYWSAKLGKKRLRARQLSRRGGELFVEDTGSAVAISGKAVLYLEGVIHV